MGNVYQFPGAKADHADVPEASNDSVQHDTETNGVTVVIAAWRAADTIGRAVASALAQVEACEVIVVDDASNDERATVLAARSADDGSGRLNVIELEENRGPAHARNIGINATTSPWICVLDSDDFMRPNRLRKLLSFAQDGHEMVADDIFTAKEDEDPGNAKPMGFADPEVSREVNLSEFVDSNINRPGRKRQELGYIKPLMRRSFLDLHKIRYQEDMRLGEDYDLYARILARGGKLRVTPATGYVSIWRAGSLSDNTDPSARVAYMNSDNRLLSMPGISESARANLIEHRQGSANILAWVDFAVAMKKGRIFTAARVMLQGREEANWILGCLLGEVRKRLGLKSS